MSNQQNRDDKIDNLTKQVGEVESRIKYEIIPQLEKVVKIVEDNIGGITTANLLNNKIVAAVIIAVIAAGIYILGKGGISL